jgi:hypothetical protein
LLLNKIELTGLLFKLFLFGARETNNIRMKEGEKEEGRKRIGWLEKRNVFYNRNVP